MNINQVELTEKEKELIEIVIDFSLPLGSSSIRFKDIINEVELDLSVPEDHIDETLSKQKLNLLAKETKKLEAEIKKWKTYEQEIYWRLSMEERQKMNERWPWLEHFPHHDLRDYIGSLENQKRKIEDLIQKKGCIQTPLLGSFSPQEKKVFLYLDNLKNTRGITYKHGIIVLREALIVTFIHEMFHAWNYFVSGSKARTVKEIDEPMVEYGSLYFLKMLALSDPRFEDIRDNAEYSVMQKQKSIGSTAAYGFGYYLYSLIGGSEGKYAMEMLAAYAGKSGTIQDSAEVRKAKAMLNPCYPFDKEKDVFVLFYQIIFPGVTLRLGISQRQQVIDALRQLGGCARLEDLYNAVDTSTWATKTPEASIRRILQNLRDKNVTFQISSGEWGLEEFRGQIEKKSSQALYNGSLM